MSATITVRNRSKTAPVDVHYTRNSNLAGGPLPMIPRRITRSRSQSETSQHFYQTTSCGHEAPHTVDADSSFSITNEISHPRVSPRSFQDGQVHALSLPEAAQPPVEQSHQSQADEAKADDQSPKPLVYTPGMLRFSLEIMRSHMLAEPQQHRHTRSVSMNDTPSAPFVDEVSRVIIRKKSGQPVKSSLKSSRSATRGNLSVMTVGCSSKSEPPTPKVVHFDTKLEHIKHFIAEQKPLAVSRDGNPTDDTSGTDSEVPLTYGDGSGACRKRKRLVMRHINGTPKANPGANVALEDYYLNFDGTSILGKIRVRNIAYCKAVAIRFTFDSWQTTSEVVGRYVESVNSQFDRFSFSIRLNDLLARIEGKTFMMAIRYSVNGQDFWDNNNCQDYVAVFTKTKVLPESKKSDDDDASDVENLRSRLEEIVRREKARNDVPRSPPKKALDLRKAEPPSLQSGVALSSRYDFATSLRNPRTWNPSVVPLLSPPSESTQPLPSRARRLTVPPLSSIPWPEKVYPLKRLEILQAPLLSEESAPLGSPRDIGEESPFSVHHFPAKGDDKCTARFRNHQRSCSEGGLISRNNDFPRGALPGTETRESKFPELMQVPDQSTAHISSRCCSFPPLRASDRSLSSSSHFDLEPPVLSDNKPQGLSQRRGLKMRESSVDSDLSTPSLASPTSSRSLTPSPTFEEPCVPLLDEKVLYPSSLPPVSPGTHYKHFLNKFCFFTGSSVASPELIAAEKQPSDGQMLPSQFGGLNVSYPTVNTDDLATIQSASPTSTTATSTPAITRAT